jgi:hypothetical protein
MHIGCCLLGVGAHVIENARQKTEFVKYHTAWLVSCYAILSSEDIQHMHDPVEGWVYHSCLLAWHFCLGPLLGMVSLANIPYLRVAVNRYFSNECQPRRFSLSSQRHQHTLLPQAATDSTFKPILYTYSRVSIFAIIELLRRFSTIITAALRLLRHSTRLHASVSVFSR